MKILKPENIDFNSLSTIIFDWGGVITNIDFQATVEAFHRIGHENFAKYLDHTYENDIFYRFERGLAEPAEIHNLLIKEIGRPVPVSTINEAFCAMLADTPLQRIDILKKLRDHFKLFLLSNTNSIHTDFFQHHFDHDLRIDFTGLFEKVYYSNRIGMRKPDREIFEYVLKENRLTPGKTLFLDDSEANVATAADLDIQAFHITPEYPMEKIFARWADQ